MIRDPLVCHILSFLFEILEYLFTFLQPNFAECWWDHVSVAPSAACRRCVCVYALCGRAGVIVVLCAACAVGAGLHPVQRRRHRAWHVDASVRLTPCA